MQKINVLVVDDSAFMRRMISDMINSDPQMNVIGTARDGVEGIEKTEKLKPDVITMDIEMPRMNGLVALEKIVMDYHIPVIMFSSLTKEGAKATLDALSAGAFDFLPKPDNVYFANLDAAKIELISKINAATKVNLGNLKKQVFSSAQSRPVATASTIAAPIIKTSGLSGAPFKKLVAIGTSTGGPRALQEVLPFIPGNIDASILVVQHMPPNFTKSLAERLNSMSQIEVKEAENGESLRRGVALIAPGNYHMLARRKNDGTYYVELNQDAEVEGHRPSATAMMRSVAGVFASSSIGVIMTGMGGDGSDGMVDIKNAGGKTIAEDESTCVVFGMPKVAIKKNAVDYVVPLPKIARHIADLV